MEFNLFKGIMLVLIPFLLLAMPVSATELKDDKLFEGLASATGKSADELKEFPHITQVQVYLPDSKKYVVLDDVLVETTKRADGSDAFNFIVSDSKLTGAAPWTTSQGEFLKEFDKAQQAGKSLTMELRSSKFDNDSPFNPIRLSQGDQVSIEAITKVFTQGGLDIIEKVN